jgi:hypothetical protein
MIKMSAEHERACQVAVDDNGNCAGLLDTLVRKENSLCNPEIRLVAYRSSVINWKDAIAITSKEEENSGRISSRKRWLSF